MPPDKKLWICNKANMNKSCSIFTVCNHKIPHKNKSGCNIDDCAGMRVRCIPYKEPEFFGGVEDLVEVECPWCGKKFIKSTNRCHWCYMYFTMEDK